MLTHIIEVTQTSEFNWGKFLVGQFDHEWSRKAVMKGAKEQSLVRGRGWGPQHVFVLDLQTGEGAILPRVSHWDHEGTHQLNNKHKIWTCPMMEPFLNWFLRQPFEKVTDLPDQVKLDTEIADMVGNRGDGPYRTAVETLCAIAMADTGTSAMAAEMTLRELHCWDEETGQPYFPPNWPAVAPAPADEPPASAPAREPSSV